MVVVIFHSFLWWFGFCGFGVVVHVLSPYVGCWVFGNNCVTVIQVVYRKFSLKNRCYSCLGIIEGWLSRL